MSITTYQGYANHQTWATCLWLDNEQTTYEQAHDMATEYRQIAHDDENVANGIWSTEEATRFRLADALQEWVEETLPGLEGASLEADLLRSSFQDIDWHEVADHYLGQ